MNLSSDELKEILKTNPDISIDSAAGFTGKATGSIEVSGGTSDRVAQSKPSKYGNHRTEFNGQTYASGKEAARAGELQLLERSHQIFGLCYQVRFPVSGGTYIADFVYSELLNGQLVTIIEDTKGFKTPIYRRNKKQMKEKYGIEIRES